MGELRPFSSGVLTAYPGLRGSGVLPDATQVLSGAPLTATRTVNSGSMYGDAPGNIVDGNAGTTAEINSHTAASPHTANDWFDVDTGNPYTYTTIVVKVTAQGAGVNTLNVWAADSPGSIPSVFGAELLASIAVATGTNTIALTAPVQGRHLLLEVVNTEASSVTVSEVTATVYSGIVFALLQDISATHKFSGKKDLYGPAWISAFPVDVGFAQGEIELQATYASISAAGLRKLIGSVETAATVGEVTTLTETIHAAVALPSFAAVLQTQDTSGVSQYWNFANCRAPGVSIPAKIADFAMPKFSFCAYPDGQENLAYYQIPQA